MKTRIIFFILVLNYLVGFAQKETAWWFFGNKAGLHFQTNSVTPLPGVSPLNGAWGYSSISDSAGNLLFYSNYSNYVFNKMHDTMANGIISGSIMGPQPSLIMRKSGNLYYLFKNASNNFFLPGIPPILSYSIIDMSLASGNGSVTIKDVPITPAGMGFAKMAGARHCNGKDYWLLTHRADMPNGGNQFYAYLVSSTGISSSPVISSIGSNQPHHYANFLSFHGRMKFSPNGRKVCSVYPNRTVELYDFNTGSGQLTNVMKLDSMVTMSSTVWPIAYDVEFSPDGTKLYVSYFSQPLVGQTHPFLCQFDLTLGSAQAIAGSKAVIDPAFDYGNEEMQLGMDGKIYIGQNSTNLSIIHNPNLPGLACNYDSVGINMGIVPGSTVQAFANRGLPNFVSGYFEQKPLFTYMTSCGSIGFNSPTVTASFATGYSVTSYQWNFGDPLSGALNTSTLANPSHVFSLNGNYQIKLILNYTCGADTLKQNVSVSGLPSISINGKPTICKGESLVLQFGGANTYSVNGNAVTQNSASVQPSVTSVYTVSGYQTSSGCSASSTISVAVKPCTGIYESEQQAWLTGIYPNPFQEELKVELRTSAHAILMDFTGRELSKEELFSGINTLNLNILSNGIYFLRLENENGSAIFKLVKE